MTGKVNEQFEAVLDLRLRGPEGEIAFEGVIDTGFTDFLLLPVSILRSLGAHPEDDTRAVLGDGSTVVFDVYTLDVLWEGEWRRVRAFAGEGVALVGVSLLIACDLHVRFLPGAEVRIVAI